jgi:hypothetical protein
VVICFHRVSLELTLIVSTSRSTFEVIDYDGIVTGTMKENEKDANNKAHSSFPTGRDATLIMPFG